MFFFNFKLIVSCKRTTTYSIFRLDYMIDGIFFTPSKSTLDWLMSNVLLEDLIKYHLIFVLLHRNQSILRNTISAMIDEHSIWQFNEECCFEHNISPVSDKISTASSLVKLNKSFLFYFILIKANNCKTSNPSLRSPPLYIVCRTWF